MSEAGEDFEIVRTTFGMVPEWVDEVVTDGTALRVYVRLSRKYANARTRECYPSQHALGEELGISATAVKRAIAHLKECGALFVRRSRQQDGRLGRNVYWLPMDMIGHKYKDWLAPDHQGSPVADGDKETPAQHQGSPVADGDQGSYSTPGPEVEYDPSTNQTHELTKQKTADAAAPEQAELNLPLPAVPEKQAEEEKPLTLNQRATRAAQWYYRQLGNMGSVPAFMKIIRKAMEREFTDAQIKIALQFIVDRRWTLTEERLANALKGGPQPAGKLRPGANGKTYLPSGMELQRS